MGLSFCASVLFFSLDVELGAGGRAAACCGHNRLGSGSGKDVAGFLCSLKILTQWHWGLGRGPVWAFVEVSILTGPYLDGVGNTCREGEIPFHNGCTFSNSFSCMGVCPSRNWLIQVHQGLSSGHPGLIRFPSATQTGRYDVQRRVKAGRLLPCPLAASVTSTSAPACLRASPPTPPCPTCTAYPLIPPASKNTMTAGEDFVGEDVPDSRMSAALLVASTRANWIPMNAFDLASQLRAPLPTDQVQSRDVVRLRALSMRISWAVAMASRKHRLGAVVSSLHTMRTPARSS